MCMSMQQNRRQVHLSAELTSNNSSEQAAGGRSAGGHPPLGLVLLWHMPSKSTSRKSCSGIVVTDNCCDRHQTMHWCQHHCCKQIQRQSIDCRTSVSDACVGMLMCAEASLTWCLHALAQQRLRLPIWNHHCPLHLLQRKKSSEQPLHIMPLCTIA